MAVDSIRGEVIARFIARLQQISTANGFLTEAGASLLVGVEPNLGSEDAAPGLVVFIGEDTVSFVGEHSRVTLPFVVQAIARVQVGPEIADPMATQNRVEELLRDVKVALELEDRRLGLGDKVGKLERGSTSPLPREPGAEFVGASIVYRIGFSEKWGQP